MYMNYIIYYRMKERNADIGFQAEAATALLDFLAHDDTVGVVCARTRPLGSGPMAWYQTFEYAFGHWFQKSAEHV